MDLIDVAKASRTLSPINVLRYYVASANWI